MDKENVKPWERPWTTEEMREHSANWNLAGDAGLLNHLQEFSQNLLSRTHATEVALDKLIEDMKTSSINVQNLTNMFSSLANTQFVENRVYDDDEKETPPEEKKDDLKNIKTKEEQENEVFKNVKKALEMGMSLLDTHFDAVEVPASDSDEEESSASMGRLILKPKNPYLSRPLPYLIGSQEFMDDDNVGLGDVSSDTEESPDQNIIQSSESDEDIAHDDVVVTPKRQTLSSSDTENSEPESDRSESVVKQKKMKVNSYVGFVDKEEEQDMFGQESPPEADVMSIVKGGLKSAFSDELASKFGTNKPLIQSQEKDDLFAPSSGTEDDTALFGKTSRTFSDKQGLFDDVNDWQNTSDSLWNNKSTNKIATDPVISTPLRNEHLFGSGNFDDDLHSDNIFKNSKQNLNKSLDVSQNVQISTSTPQNVTADVHKNEVKKKVEEDDIVNKKIKGNSPSLFDKDDLEEDDLFAIPPAVSISSEPSLDSSTKAKLPKAVRESTNENLFGDISPVSQQDSLIHNRNFIVERSTFRQEPSSGIGITIDNITQKEENESQEQQEEPPEKSLTFDSKLFQGTSTKIQNDMLSKSSLFREEKNSDSIFDQPRHQDQNRSIVGGNISGSKLFPSLKTKSKKSVSLFDDSDSGDDELLFSSTSSTSSRSRRSQGSGDILSSVGEKVLSKKGLFEDSTLFGSDSKEEPEVDIFKPLNDTKSTDGSVNKKSSFEKSILDTNPKASSSIFDNIDDVDDIFAVTKPSIEEVLVDKRSYFQSSAEKSLLFSEECSNANDTKAVQHVNNMSKGENDLKAGSSKNNLEASIGSENSLDNLRNLNSSSVQPQQDLVENQSLENHNSSESVVTSEVSYSFKDNSNPHEVVPSVNFNQLFTNQESSEVSVNPIPVNNITDPNTSTDVRKISNQISNVKAEPPRSLNIRKTTNVLFESPSNDDDLFETLQTKKTSCEKEHSQQTVSNENISNSSSFGKLLEGFNSISNVNLQENSEKSIEEKNNSTSDQQFHSEQTADVTAKVPFSSLRAPNSSPRKLFIDPRALLPGAKPPSITSTSDGAVGFDKPAETSSILHSAGKERVKIQVKRRPPTRKARQEALRASYVESDSLDASLSSHLSNNKRNHTEDKLISSGDRNLLVNNIRINNVFSEVTEKSLEDEQTLMNSNRNLPVEEKSESSNITSKSDTYKNFLSDGISNNSNPLSPLTDEEDLFAVPHEFPGEETNCKEISNSTKNLFGGAPVLSPLNDILDSKVGHSTASIFDNGVEEDFMSEEKGASNPNVISDDKKIEEVLNDRSRKTSPTSYSSESYNNPSGNSMQALLAKPIDSKLFEEDSEHGKGLFDKSNYLEDDDNLFSSLKKNDRRTQNLENESADQVKLENNRTFSTMSSSGFSLFPSSPAPISDGESPKPSVFEEKNVFSEFENKLPLTNESFAHDEKVLNKPSNILHRQDSDDLFTQSGKLKISCNTASSVHSEKTKSHVDSLFGDDSTEADDLFGSSSVTVAKKVVAPSGNYLFSDSKAKGIKESLFDDCDDDIFTVGTSKSQGQGATSLFIGEDISVQKESDVLFTKTNTYSKQQSSKQSSAQKMQPKEDSFEDPLMVIKK